MAFHKLDTVIGEYYKSYNIDDYFDNGIGRFLKYVQSEEMDENEIDTELGDDCAAHDCSYLQFDTDNFPLEIAYINESDKNEKIFGILQYCYKNNKPPPSMFENKLTALSNDINSIITQQMNQHIADTTSTTFISAVKVEQFTIDQLINDIIESDANDSLIIDKMIDIDNNKNNNDAILHLHRECIHKYIKLAIDLSNGNYNCFNSEYLNKIVISIEKSFINCYSLQITHKIQICFCLFIINNGLDDDKYYQTDIISLIKNDLLSINSYLLTNILQILLNYNYFVNKYAYEDEDLKVVEINDYNYNINSTDEELKTFESKRIHQNILAILYGNQYFNISNINFQFNDETLEYGKELVRKHCRMIYSKHPGDFKANDPFKNSKNKNNIGDKALCIAKCIEIENGYPILSMLLDTFSRDRVNGHKINTTIYNLSISDDRYAIRYDAIKWWNEDCIFGRYISKKYPNKADAMMHAVAELSFRVLPKYNFQYVLSHIICDSLNAFVKYTISFHHVIHKIIKSMSLAGHCEAAPLQFDFWIIPQATKPTTRMNNIYDEKELYSDNDNDDDDNTVQYEYEKYEKNKINQDYIHENLIYNEMGKSGYHQKAQNAFWDLEEYLIKDGYKENIDYFVQGITGDIGLRTEQIIKMWKLSADADRIRYKRYIIIIDRRNPMNLRHKNMDFKTPNIYKSEIQWKDRLYLIKPKLTTKNSNGKLQFKKKDVQNITKKFYLVPEALLGYSKTYLFPNPDKHEPGPICILDAINGYKFCLSYHILQTDCVKVYWYTNQGSQRFKLDDMKWLWSKCFQKINNQWQTINNENMELLNDNIYGKDLIDAKFQEFWRQIHDINNVHFKPFLTSNNELFRPGFKEFL